MIRECTTSDMGRLIAYIGKDYGKCIYIYIDLIKYGLENENLFAWIQEDGKGNICALITEYYKGIQLYSKDLDLLHDEMADFLLEKDPPVIMGLKPTVDLVRQHMPGYVEEVGIIGQLGELGYPANEDAYAASRDELEEIVRIVAADEDIGIPYGFDSLYEQYTERYDDDFGRNFILRDKETKEVICHVGTYAELDDVAVIGGVITAPKYRGKGWSKGTLAAICRQLREEDKDIFSFFYVPSAKSMHYGVGFEKLGDWAKISREDDNR